MKKSENQYCQCLYYTANALSRKITKMADEAFAPTGLAPSHAFLMMSINREAGLQPSQLSEIMLLTPSTLTRLIEKLESRKLVERGYKGKYTYVFPTAEGKKLNPKLKIAWESLYKNYTSILGENEARNLTKQIFKSIEKLES